MGFKKQVQLRVNYLLYKNKKKKIEKYKKENVPKENWKIENFINELNSVDWKNYQENERVCLLLFACAHTHTAYKPRGY